MEDTPIYWIAMEIFVWLAFAFFSFLKAYIKRASNALRPENCEKCTGSLKEKSVKKAWYRGMEYELLSYKYAYTVNGEERELAFERRSAAKNGEDRYELPETIEIFYNADYPRRAYSRDVETDYNPARDRCFAYIMDAGRCLCIIAAVFCIYELIKVLT